MGDVEFFVDDGGAVSSDEDDVEFGARPVPRWAIVAGCVAAAAAAVAVVTTSSHPKATSSPPPPAPAVRSAAPVPNLVATGRLGAAVPLGAGGGAALDAVIHRERLYVLRSGAVTVVDMATGTVVTTSLTDGGLPAGRSPPRLLLDAGADRLWVLDRGAQATQLVEINASRMQLIRHLTLRLAVNDAAAMDGHVYLATQRGLSDLAPGSVQPHAVPGTLGAVSAVAADPRRHRILALDVSAPYAVVVANAGGVTSRRMFGNLRNGTIAVVGDAIWVGGFDLGEGGRRALVARLDPATLAPVQTSAVAQQVDRVVVSPGTRNVWVSSSGPGLWCLDADSGTVLEHWPSAIAPVTSQAGTGPVVSRLGSGYVIDSGSVRRLELDGCVG